MWVLALPGTDTTLDLAEFAESMESLLFLLSTAVKHMVGETIEGGGVCAIRSETGWLQLGWQGMGGGEGTTP